MSRSLTGIVKAGYSPHEQYAIDGRLQGPWSDIYAFGGTLYRAVTGKAPEEATLRFDEDHLAPVSQLARGKYRSDFLAAIDACLKVRHSERPQSVTQLRPMLLEAKAKSKGTEPPSETYKSLARSIPIATARQVARRWPAIAATLAVVAGGYVRFQYRSASEAEARQHPANASVQQQAALDTAKRGKEEAADARQRQIDIEEARRRRDLVDAAEAERRKDEAAAEEKRREERRIAALEDARRSEEKHKTDDLRRLAANPTDDERAVFVKRIQEALKRNQCYSGNITGRTDDAQPGVDRFIENPSRMAMPSSRRKSSWPRPAWAISRHGSRRSKSPGGTYARRRASPHPEE